MSHGPYGERPVSNQPIPDRPTPERPVYAGRPPQYGPPQGPPAGPPAGPPLGGRRANRRRRKRASGRIGLTGALAAAVGVAALAVGIAALRPDGGGPASPPAVSGRGGATPNVPTTPEPQAGAELRLTTPEGYGYALAAVRAGVTSQPFKSSSPAPEGSGHAYADYVLSNTQRRPVLLDFPADLFVPAEHVPGDAADRCMPQPGIPDDMCTLPNSSQVIARVDRSGPLIPEAGDMLIPAGGSYLVRIATDVPVASGLESSDLRLYVWNARYTSDRKGIEVAFP